MNPIFEIKFYKTDEMLVEFVKKVLSKKIKIIGAIFFFISLVMFIVTMLDKSYILSALFAITLFLSGCVSILASSIMMKDIKQRAKQIHNGEKVLSIVKFDDKIYISEGSSTLTLQYSQIHKVYSLEHIYALMIGKNNGIIISPEHFTIGTFEDFKLFINSKCNLG